MRTLILFLGVSFLSLVSSNKLDEDNGFANYKFGTTPAEFKNLTLELDEGKTQLYSAENATNINGVKIKYLRVTFCKNQLSAISFETDRSGKSFFASLKEKYGEPQKIKTNYQWLSKNVQLLYEPLDANDGVVSFYSREIYDHKQAKK